MIFPYKPGFYDIVVESQEFYQNRAKEHLEKLSYVQKIENSAVNQNYTATVPVLDFSRQRYRLTNTALICQMTAMSPKS